MRSARTLAAAALVLALAGGARAASGSGITGAVVANPLKVVLTLSTSQTQVGSRLGAGATVGNLGRAALAGVTLSLRADPSLTISPAAPWSPGTLAGGGTTAAAWLLCASAPGNYVVVAHATGSAFAADSPAQLVAVTAGRGRCR